MIKRMFDVLVSTMILVATSPLLLIVAVAVRLSSRGPILFRQARVGFGGKDFILLKFRSMTVRTGSEQGSFDAGNTSRITRVGAVIRKSKLDELPQLWNVIVGDMSLVGPRPEVRKWVDVDPDQWAYVHTVKPGITDPASIIYRNEEELLAASADPELTYRNEILPRKLALYRTYVDTQTFWGDVRILLQTVLAVFLGPPKLDETPTSPAREK